jgi:hypothetical protein
VCRSQLLSTLHRFGLLHCRFGTHSD